MAILQNVYTFLLCLLHFFFGRENDPSKEK